MAWFSNNFSIESSLSSGEISRRLAGVVVNDRRIAHAAEGRFSFAPSRASYRIEGKVRPTRSGSRVDIQARLTCGAGIFTAALPVILIPVLVARGLWILDALVVGFIVLAWVAIHRSLRVGVVDARRFFEAPCERRGGRAGPGGLRK